jgi:hypothetical protein
MLLVFRGRSWIRRLTSFVSGFTSDISPSAQEHLHVKTNKPPLRNRCRHANFDNDHLPARVRATAIAPTDEIPCHVSRRVAAELGHSRRSVLRLLVPDRSSHETAGPAFRWSFPLETSLGARDTACRGAGGSSIGRGSIVRGGDV